MKKITLVIEKGSDEELWGRVWIFYYDGGHYSPGRGPKIIGLMWASLRG